MNSFTTSLHRRLAPFLVLVGAVGVAACSTQVDIAQSAGATGSGGSTSSTTTATSTTSTTSTASTTSGTGGSNVIGPLNCHPGDAAIVAGSSYQRTAVVLQMQGQWSEVPDAVPGAATQTAAYVDVYNRLNVLWTEQAPGGDQAHFIGTQDGASFETHDVKGWHPAATLPILSLGSSILLGHDGPGTSLAYYDPDAFDWMTWQTTTFKATSAAASATGVVLVGVGPDHVLCDVTLDSEIMWGPTKCHPELPVFDGNEIPVPLPQIVALAGGDVVAVYHTSSIELTAVVRHAGQWSAPQTLTLPNQALSWAITTTPQGEVLAAVVFTTGELAAIRFSQGAGWGSPITLDTGASEGQLLAAAPGICGDDALIAYAAVGTVGEVRVARVRGGASATTSVAHFTDDVPARISLATRHGAVP